MRVSLEDQAKGGSTSKSSTSSSRGHDHGHHGHAKAGMPKAQKIKAGVAGGVILLAGIWIAYSQGIFAGGPRVDKFPDPTPEALEQFNREAEAQAKQQQEQPQTGNARVAPLGAQ